MAAGFVPPAAWTETTGQLRVSGIATLAQDGTGVITFDPDSANQRWVVTSIAVKTNQPSTQSLVPFCTVALNTTELSQLSQGNDYGTTYSGNNDQFSTPVDVGPCDFLSLLFYPPPGTAGSGTSPLQGVIASAVLTGTKYTRRR